MSPLAIYIAGAATASIIAAVLYINDRRIRRRNARRKISNIVFPPNHQFRNLNPPPRPMQKPVVVDWPARGRDIHYRHILDPQQDGSQN